MPRQPRVVHACHGGVRGEVLGHRQRGRGVPGHAQLERLQSLEEVRRVGGGQGRAQIVQEPGAHQGEVGRAPVALHQGPPSEAGLGPRQPGPPLGVRPEVERAAVHDRSPERRAVPSQELRGRVDHHVRAVLERPVQGRGGEGRVHHHGDAGGVGRVRQRRQVGQGRQRVRDGLQEEGAGLRSDGRGPGAGVGGVDGRHRDPQVPERVRQQVHRPAVELAGGHQVRPGGEQGQQRQRHRGLPAGRPDGADAALQGREAGLERGHGGVARPAVGEPGHLLAEEGHGGGVVREPVGGALVDGHGHRVVRPLRRVARVDLLGGRVMHALLHRSWREHRSRPLAQARGRGVAAASWSQVSRPLGMVWWDHLTRRGPEESTPGSGGASHGPVRRHAGPAAPPERGGGACAMPCVRTSRRSPASSGPAARRPGRTAPAAAPPGSRPRGWG